MATWTRNINRKDWNPGPGARVCSAHFISATLFNAVVTLISPSLSDKMSHSKLSTFQMIAIFTTESL